ncbi:MAG: hypothetical protein CVU69_02370 [Deltaproteobacteria bacterium HGW-Deltaproteobacteria-4]|nr:MAG: hypothetical protein CVU69_02370 [Deltaproteobacteria bacterium HGW-Deltaproteobacteria-4]
MKILFVTPGCFDKGGISRYSRYQISALRDLWGEGAVRVFSLLGQNCDSFEEDFKVHWSAGGIGMAAKVRFALRLAKEILLWRPDVVHVAHVNLSGLAWGLAHLSNAKTLLNTYGLEVWSGLSPDAALGLRKMQHVLSDCYYTACYLENEGLRPAKSTSVIWDCVDLDQFSPGGPSPVVLARYGIPDPELHFNLMTLGRLSFSAAHKGYERLLKAFAIVAPLYPQCRLIIAGKGDMCEELRRQAASLGVNDRVIFTGMVHDGDLADVYRAAHLFSLVSDRGLQRGEGIPLTPLEAMACGVPILVGNHDGSQEAVATGENGFVLDPFDLDAHAGIIGRLVADRELLHKLGVGATKRARQFFSYEDFREKNCELYTEIFKKEDCV